MNRIKLAVFGLVTVLSVPALALDIESELKQCMTVTDSLKRLVCYDVLVKKMEVTNANKAVNESSINSVTSNIKQVDVEQKIVAKPVERFGTENKKVKKQQVDEVSFTIKSISKTVRGKLIVTFENGQVWQQKDTETVAKYVAGEVAVIKRGVFDSFYMKKPNANRTIRVTRIK